MKIDLNVFILYLLIISPVSLADDTDSGKIISKPPGSHIENGSLNSTLSQYKISNAELLPVRNLLSDKTKNDVPFEATGEKNRPAMSGSYIFNKQLVSQVARPFPEFGVILGQGWNSFLNRQSANVCIEGATESLKGIQFNSSVTSIEDRASYYEAISASAGASYGPFSGSGGYSKENNFSAYDANIVMNVVVDSGGTFIKPSSDKGIQLSSYALALLNSKNPSDGVSRFLQACGDSFITTIREGGRMTAVLNISNVSSSQKEEIKAQASGGVGILSANANFRKTVESATSGNKLKVSFEQVGGVFTGTPVSIQDFLDKFSQYKVDQAYNPRPYVFYTMNYRTLPNWPSGLENRVSPVDQDYFVLSYYNFMQIVSDYDRYLSHPDLYRNFIMGGDESLQKYRDEGLMYARSLDDTIWECVNNFNCSTAELNDISEEMFGADLEADKEGKLNKNVNDSSNYRGGDSLFPLALDGFSTEVNIVYPGGYDKYKKGANDISMAGNSSDMLGGKMPSMTVIYYQLLSALPVFKDDYKPPVKSDGKLEADDVILRSFKDYLISTRIRPVSNTYCRKAASHYLCLSTREMRDIISLIHVNLDAIRTVTTPNPSVELPKPPVVVPAPRPPRIDFCDRLPRRCPI